MTLQEIFDKACRQQFEQGGGCCFYGKVYYWSPAIPHLNGKKIPRGAKKCPVGVFIKHKYLHLVEKWGNSHGVTHPHVLKALRDSELGPNLDDTTIHLLIKLQTAHDLTVRSLSSRDPKTQKKYFGLFFRTEMKKVAREFNLNVNILKDYGLDKDIKEERIPWKRRKWLKRKEISND